MDQAGPKLTQITCLCLVSDDINDIATISNLIFTSYSVPDALLECVAVPKYQLL